MSAASVLVKSAVATSAAVLLVAHRDHGRRPAVGEPAGGCPVMRALGRVPAQTGPSEAVEAAAAHPEYSV